MGFLKPPKIDAPEIPPPPPAFGQIQGEKPAKKSTTPTFLGRGMFPGKEAGSTLTSNTQGKTLLGQ